jgi:predicted nucleotidyltransferase component of viral defense system
MKTIEFIEFKNSEAKDIYDKFKVVRSESLYQKVAEFLISEKLNGNKTIDFEIVSDWVKYDKALKKV